MSLIKKIGTATGITVGLVAPLTFLGPIHYANLETGDNIDPVRACEVAAETPLLEQHTLDFKKLHTLFVLPQGYAIDKAAELYYKINC